MKYRPLRNGTDVRLIEFPTYTKSKENVPNDVHIKLFKVDLRKAPDYKALSYCWGDSSNKVNILVNGETFAVTRNLYTALLQLQSANRYLWVDAICINQEDATERAIQVLLMRQIYSQASSVIAWLGETQENTVAALATILFFEHCWEQYLLNRQIDVTSEDYFKPDVPALCQFLENQYFERIWIVQENRAAKLVTYQCGKLAVFSKSILHACEWLYFREDDIVTESARLHVNLATEILENKKVDKPASLTDFLHRFRPCQATDPRDKLYALLGLVEETGHGHEMIPDYTLSVKEVYSQAVRQSISARKDLAILSDAQMPFRSADLPSWVPDWRLPADQLHIDVRDVAGAPFYHASNTSSASIASTQDMDELALSGITVDNITSVFRFDNQVFNIDDTHAAFLTELEKAIESLKMGPLYSRVTGDTAQQALFRVLSLDMLRASTEYFSGSCSSGADLHNVHFTSRTSPSWVGVYLPLTMQQLQLEEGKVDLETDRSIFESDLFEYLGGVTEHRVMFTTEKGYVGLGSEETSIEDTVVVLSGGNLPFVLRQKGAGKYKFGGECYLHGVMDGEAMNKAMEEDIQLFVLV